METPTHYMNVTLAVDFKKVFSPEYIQGVKLMLGVQNDNEIINVISNNIISDMGKAIEAKDSFVSIINANINPVPEQSPEQGNIEPEAYPDEDYHAIEESYSQPDMHEEENDEFIEVYDESEDTPLLYDDYSDKLINSIGDDIFKIESHLGSEITIYLREYDSYAPTVSNELGEYAVVSFSELGEQASELQTEDYVIQYKDMNNELKYGSRNLNKIEDTEEESF